MDKAQVQSLTEAMAAWWDWEVVREGEVGTRGMGNRGGAEDKGKFRSVFRPRNFL
jgi:hypothetical protein